MKILNPTAVFKHVEITKILCGGSQQVCVFSVAVQTEMLGLD